eukprot:scaffold133041_cov31-Tisochrysis_lutea.AAC.2
MIAIGGPWLLGGSRIHKNNSYNGRHQPLRLAVGALWAGKRGGLPRRAMIRGSRVDLLAQAKEEGPREALTRLGFNVEAQAGQLKPDAQESARSLLVQCLQQAKAESVRKASDNSVWLHEHVIGTLNDQRIGYRNRALFLVSVLAADTEAALALVGAGAIEALSQLISASTPQRLTLTERQWVLVALNQLTNCPLMSARKFVKSRIPPLLLDIINEMGIPRARYNEPDRLETFGASAAEEMQHPYTFAFEPGEAALPEPSIASPTSSVSAEVPSAAGPRISAEDERGQVGLCYAAMAVVANLSLHADGARELVRCGIHSALLSLLTARRGTLSLPSTRWLVTRQRSMLHNASLGGGAARAVLNLAYAGHDHAHALLAAGALPWLERLQSEPLASERVRDIAQRAAAYLSEIASYSEPKVALLARQLDHRLGKGVAARQVLKAGHGYQREGGSPAAGASLSACADPGFAGARAELDAADAPQGAEILCCPSQRRHKRKRKGRPLVGRKRSKAGAKDRNLSGSAEDTPSMCEFDRILARRLRAGQPEYLIKWRDPQGGSSTWEPVDHIHDPATVAAFERGSSAAAAYPDWAWSLDPRGAGWACLPLDVHSTSLAGCERGSRGREREGRQRLPENWPEAVVYTPFILWHQPMHPRSTEPPPAPGAGVPVGVRMNGTEPPTPSAEVAVASTALTRAQNRVAPGGLDERSMTGLAVASQLPAPNLEKVGHNSTSKGVPLTSARPPFGRLERPTDTCVADARNSAVDGTELFVAACGSKGGMISSSESLRLQTSRWRRLAGVVIKALPPDHPVAPQHGLFASESIPCGALIGNYTGLVKLQQGKDSSRYLVEVHDRQTGHRFDIDAEHYGNETRFINDYKGIAVLPNVAFVLHYAQGTGEMCVGVVTQRHVQKGEELLVDYGRHFWQTPLSSRASSAPNSPIRATHG